MVRRPVTTREQARSGTLSAVGLAALLGLISAVANIDAAWWTGLRIGVAVVFAIYGVAWLDLALRERRRS
jgi:flagellar motor component MotA